MILWSVSQSAYYLKNVVVQPHTDVYNLHAPHSTLHCQKLSPVYHDPTVPFSSTHSFPDAETNNISNQMFKFKKYLWVYSYLGLKAIQTELLCLLVQIVLGHEGVMQKNCIELLQCHRQMLEQE